MSPTKACRATVGVFLSSSKCGNKLIHKLKIPVNLLFRENNKFINDKPYQKPVNKIKVSTSRCEHFQHYNVLLLQNAK
jgi:hypothetical protein